MKRSFLALFAFFLAIGPASQALSGGSSAHGGDLERDQDNVWFLGETPVEYCIVRKTDYPLSEDILSGLIKEAIEAWRVFFAKYGIDKARFSGFPDGVDRGLSLEFQRVAHCSKPGSQLIFSFAEDTLLAREYRPDGDEALGLAVRQSYNHETYRSGGTVWIARFSSDPRLVKHMLLHELGHVFGMAHNSVWVMDDTVARRLTDLNEVKDPAIGAIESPSWPFMLRPGETLNFTYRYAPWGGYPAGFAPNWLIGGSLYGLLGFSTHDYLGAHRLTLQYSQEPEADAPFGRNIFTLNVQYPSRSPVHLKGTFDLVRMRGGGPTLYTKWGTGTNAKFEKHYLVEGVFPIPSAGYFIGPDGSKIPAILTTHWGPVLRMFSPGSGIWWNTESYELSLERRQMDQY